MFTSFPLLVEAGVGYRLALFNVLRTSFGLSPSVPQLLATVLIDMAD